nr:predicted GPI-anchored protein 58 [Aegilops tauschii subsp. strangulata]
MGDKRKNTGDGETPPAKGRPGLKPAMVPSPVAVEAPQRSVMAPSPAAVEAAPTPVAVEKPVTAPSPAAVEAAPTPVAVEKPVTAPSPAAVEAAATPVPVEAPETAPSAMVLAGGTVAVAAAEGDVVTLLESEVPKTVLRCNECHHPLKPPLAPVCDT